MSTVFSKIIAGEIPCYKIHEEEQHLAFLDIQPLSRGHVLVIPKKEVDYIFDLNPNEYSALWSFAHKIAPAIKKAIPCNRVGIAVIGLEVAHAHIHLIPINNVQDINFSAPKLSFSREELNQTASEIRQALS